MKTRRSSPISSSSRLLAALAFLVALVMSASCGCESFSGSPKEPGDKSPAPAADDSTAMSVPALIAKGRDYFVHVVREHSDGYPFWSGYTLLHTRRSTGVMTRLLTTSDWTAQQIVGGNWADPETAIGMAPQLHSRLVGICSDPERLYALVRQEGIDILCEKFAGEILLVFCLQDGSKLAELEVKGGTLWKPAEGLHEGPMRPVRNGVSIYGKTFLFRGKEVQQR